MSAITIYTKIGDKRATVPITQDAVHVLELMKEHYVQLVFNSLLIELAVGDYIIHEQQKFYLIELPKPTRNGSAWKYDIRFESFESSWKNCIMFFIPETGAKESEWTLTSNPHTFVEMAVKNINRFFGTEIKVANDTVVAETQSISFTNVSVWDALSNIAEIFKTEWWFDGENLHLNKREYGSGQELKVNRQIQSSSSNKGDQTGYATRIYPYGSTRNILPETTSSATTSILNNRLKLNGIEYIDARPNLTNEEIVEAVVIFEDIYPRMKGKTISAVRDPEETIDDTKQNVYYFKIANLGFDPKPLIIDRMNLSVKFESGNLNGREFELNWHSDTEEFEILNVSESGTLIIPNPSLCPAVGDTLVLFNLKMPDSYKAEAQAELLTAAKEYILESSRDRTVYTCPSNPVYCAKNSIDYEVGQRVILKGDEFGTRESRIQRTEKKLYNKYICTYQIGDNAEYSRLNNIEREARSANYAISEVSHGSGSIPVITLYDITRPTDYNVFSSLRTRAEIDALRRKTLRKDIDDTADGLITLKKGARFGNYEPDSAGGAVVVDEKGTHAEFDYITARKKAYFKSLEIQHSYHVGGEQIISHAAMTCSRMKEYSDFYRCYFEKEDADGKRIYNQFVLGDQARCQTFNLESSDGIISNHYYWRLVVGIGADFIDLSIYDCDTGSDKPLDGDRIIQLGNRDIVTRQNAQIISAFGVDAPSFKQYDDINSYSLEGCYKTGFTGKGNKIKGDLFLDTGESVSSKLAFTEGKLLAEIDSVRSEMQFKESCISNPFFDEGMHAWETDNDVSFFLIGGKWMFVNNQPLSNKKSYAGVVNYDGRNMVFVSNRYLMQRNANMHDIPLFEAETEAGELQTRTFWVYFFYRAKTAGTLTVSIENSDTAGFETHTPLSMTQEIEPNAQFTLFEGCGAWNGKGDLKIAYTGQMYLYGIKLSTDKVTDMEIRYNTRFEMTDKKIDMFIAAFDDMGEKLRETGINIEDREININADKLKINTSTGNPVAVFEDLNGVPTLKTEAINTDKLVAKTLKSATFGPRVEIEAALASFFGNFSFPNIRLGVNEEGCAVLDFYNKDNVKTLGLGPNGFNWGAILPASWTTAKYYLIATNSLNADADPLYDDILFKLRTAQSTYGDIFYKYYAGNNPTITEAERAKEKWYIERSVSAAVMPSGWYWKVGQDNAYDLVIDINIYPIGYIKPDEVDGLYPEPEGIWNNRLQPIFVRTMQLFVNGVYMRRLNVFYYGESIEI